MLISIGKVIAVVCVLCGIFSDPVPDVNLLSGQKDNQPYGATLMTAQFSEMTFSTFDVGIYFWYM